MVLPENVGVLECQTRATVKANVSIMMASWALQLQGAEAPYIYILNLLVGLSSIED